MSISVRAVALWIALLSGGVVAQDSATKPLDESTQERVIASLCRVLRDSYVFEDKAQEIAAVLEKKLDGGEYDGLTDRMRFAEALTVDIQSVNGDKHLRVRVQPPRPSGPRPDPEEMMQRRLEQGQRRNFGFEKIEKLAGNVGYLDLRGFSSARYGGPTAIAAMAFLQYSDALIIDLRKNGGGSPDMIQLLSSYFFEERTHLNSFFWRGQEEISQFWTLPHVPGKRMVDVPLYILTSPRTFSAAEEFTYNLKNLKRATIVGKTTGGGAHPGGTRRLPAGFGVFVPQGRAINPITKTNWEGTGITPHIETSVEGALDVAHSKALEVIAANVVDPQRKRALKWAAEGLAAKAEPVAVPRDRLKLYAGNYGPRMITMDEEGTLWYRRDSGSPHRLVALGKDRFMVDGIDTFRIHFLSERGKVVGLAGHYDDGRQDRNARID